MRDKRVQLLTQGAVVAALYVVLCQIFAPISFRDVQFRVAEGLTILPCFTPAAIPGLFVGCILGNLLAGAIPADVIFGSLATLLGALGTYAIGRAVKKQPEIPALTFALPVPPIVSNAVIIPFILYYGYGITVPIPLQMLTVCLGEVLGCGVVGMILYFALSPVADRVFGPENA